MTTKDVLAIWKEIEDIPGLQNDIVFLGMGHQKFSASGKPSTDQGTGAEWLHIIARHEACFAGRQIENIFGHLSEQIQWGSRHGLKRHTVYVIHCAGKIISTHICIGTNGFVVTARPYDNKELTELLKDKLQLGPVNEDDEEWVDLAKPTKMSSSQSPHQRRRREGQRAAGKDSKVDK